MNLLRYKTLFALSALILVLSGCSSLRFVPEDKTMLASVKMRTENREVKVSDYRRFVRQEPNSKWLSCLKVPLAMYRLSGTDSTRRVNRLLQRIGEAPVVYDPDLTDFTCRSISQTLQGRGYLDAEVTADTLNRDRRTRVVYTMKPGERSFVSNVNYMFDDERMQQLVMAPAMQNGTLLYKGMPFDVAVLDEERQRIIRNLHNIGYYGLNQEFITFAADTLAGDYGVDLCMEFRCPQGVDVESVYVPYKLGNVRVYETVVDTIEADASEYNGINFYHEKGLRRHVSRRVLSAHNYLRPGVLSSEADMQYTYQSLNSLGIVHYTAINTHPHPEVLQADSTHVLDADIFVKLNRLNGLSLELEGTNTAGDLGAAASLTYTNRNCFRGAEMLSMKLRGAFEAIKGLEGYTDANYIEYGGEIALRVPRFMMPMREDVKRRIRANTEFSLQYNSQDRPEFHRRVWTGTWNYQWVPLQNTRMRHRLDMFSLNYLYMPWISDTFRRDYLEDTSNRNSILRYSYEDLFILRIGYGLTFNSLRKTGAQSLYNTNGYQVRINAELAGSMLYGIASLFKMNQNENGEYVLGNIPFSQYAKVDFDYSKSVRLTEKSSMAFHGALGVAIPYGNSTMIPYEKRYFSGGANSVRGWSVRELGPGSYMGRDGKVDFINQTGNLKLDLSAEYRAHLFWKIDGAVFVDAGNIWNTRHYEGLEKGQFHWDTFYKQIAVAYGLGLRLNFGYFILRFDGGMKAINPAVTSGRLHYPIAHPNFKRDFAFHFAVGLPF